MKKLMMVFAVMMVVGLVANVYAQRGEGTATDYFKEAFAKAKLNTAEGKVLSHDVACHCIVLQTATGTLTVQDDYARFNQEYNKVKGLKIGEPAKITYKTVDYINYATEVEQK